MKKNKNDIDIRLFLFKNIKKTFKYYFKNILYILFINIVGFYIINAFLKVPYAILIMKFFSTPTTFDIAYYGSFLIFFSTIKIILYGNTVYIMNRNAVNDIRELFFLVLKRFLPVVGTFLIYIIAVLFLSLLLIIPGVVFFFYYYFSVFLCAVGDINNKEKNKEKILNGGKALARSYNLVRNNLLRFMILTVVIAFITYFIQVSFIKFLFKLDIILSNTTYNIIRFTIWDIFIIYSALMYVKLQGIENDAIEGDLDAKRKEQIMLNKAAVNKFGKSKK